MPKIELPIRKTTLEKRLVGYLKLMYCILLQFLNQARAGLRPARAWFLKITSVRMYACVYVCVCVCVSAPEAMNN